MAIVSLGCAKNQVDTEVMLAQLAQAGYQPTGMVGAADVVIVNSCGFIESAKRESIDAVLKAVEEKRKDCKLILTGCLAQGYGQDLALVMPEVDAFVGPGMAGEIAAVVAEVLSGKRVMSLKQAGEWEALPMPRLLTGPKGSSYLKLAEGCSYQCSFCAIPRLRGPYRSRPEETILAEAGQLASQGVRELVLISQDTAAYGQDLYGEPRLPGLLRRLAQLEGINWLRLLYLFPVHVTPALLETMAAEEKVCRYLDLPLQHCSPSVLAAMRRPPLSRTLPLLSEIRSLMPDAVIRSTFIVGFPGESEEDFTQLCSFVESSGLDWIGAFVYSAEDGTIAAALPGQLPEEVKIDRWHTLMRLARDITGRRLRRLVGQEAEVLVETSQTVRGRIRGRTQGQAPEVDGSVLLRGTAAVGDMVRAQITGVRGYDLLADALGQTLPAI